MCVKGSVTKRCRIVAIICNAPWEKTRQRTNDAYPKKYQNFFANAEETRRCSVYYSWYGTEEECYLRCDRKGRRRALTDATVHSNQSVIAAYVR